MTAAPLVVTLVLDDATQQRFDAERARLFPAGRTAVGAHVTLFHAVPGELEEQVRADLAEHAVDAFDVGVDAVMSLGRGAAYRLAAPELDRVHRALQQLWWAHLTRQDRQPLRAHVTVQNKVSAEQARETVAALRASFVPFTAIAHGLALWRYDGGPWTALARFPC
ncbi:2'-5' RNA ligase family protein [uncultured Jatrophihabitans sp.]|uniref:2'-5' RNA ligase family protein n=1 Tax=uncultured Jatrophihabitans sp. TaxID=1610747 RepID=UPI0035CC8578